MKITTCEQAKNCGIWSQFESTANTHVSERSMMLIPDNWDIKGINKNKYGYLQHDQKKIKQIIPVGLGDRRGFKKCKMTNQKDNDFIRTILE